MTDAGLWFSNDFDCRDPGRAYWQQSHGSLLLSGALAYLRLARTWRVEKCRLQRHTCAILSSPQLMARVRGSFLTPGAAAWAWEQGVGSFGESAIEGLALPRGGIAT